MPRALRRQTAAVVALVAMLASSASLCLGWSSSSPERMACCLAEGHDCTGVTPDDCCVRGEGHQHGELTPGSIAPTLMPAPGFAPRVAALPPDLTPSLQSPSGRWKSLPDIHVFLSVFLI